MSDSLDTGEIAVGAFFFVLAAGSFSLWYGAPDWILRSSSFLTTLLMGVVIGAVIEDDEEADDPQGIELPFVGMFIGALSICTLGVITSPFAALPYGWQDYYPMLFLAVAFAALAVGDWVSEDSDSEREPTDPETILDDGGDA